MRLLQRLLPRRIATLLLLQLLCTLIVAFFTHYEKTHPTFFRYLWHAQHIQYVQFRLGKSGRPFALTTGSGISEYTDASAEHIIIILDKRPGIPMANGIATPLPWIIIAKPWIFFKELFRIDLGPTF